MSKKSNKQEVRFLRDRLKEIDICMATPYSANRNMWYRYHCVLETIIYNAEGYTLCANCDYNRWFEYGGIKDNCCYITGLGNKIR